EAAVLRSWQAGDAMDEATCSFTLARLCNHSLLRFESEARTVSVHQLVHAYLSQRVPDQRPLHEELLRSYAKVSSADWIDGPTDGYYYQHLVHHLLSARGAEAACALLVGSPKWMERKVAIEGGPLSFLLDVDLAFRHIADGVDALALLARLA